jgi:hypothetical protein
MSENIEDVLFKQGILFDLDIGRWAAHKKLDKDDLFLQQINPNAFHLGHKKLMPKESIEKIQKIESAARSALMACSADFPIAGARFVRYPVLENLQNKLLDLKSKYHDEVAQFLKNYPELRAKQMEVLNEQADILADDRLARLENVKLDDEKKVEAIDAINTEVGVSIEPRSAGVGQDLDGERGSGASVGDHQRQRRVARLQQVLERERYGSTDRPTVFNGNRSSIASLRDVRHVGVVFVGNVTDRRQQHGRSRPLGAIVDEPFPANLFRGCGHISIPSG